MENRKLSPEIMLRVKACALLFASTRAQKIAEIAAAKGIDLEAAAIMYTIGALKRSKRLGIAKNYVQALERLECEQVGDRGSAITKTLSADKTAREIARINHINEGERFSMDGIHYLYDYDNVITVKGAKKTIAHFSIIDDKPVTEPKPAKVLGTLYAQWESRQDQLDPADDDNEMARADIDQIRANLILFFADYTARLSNTAKKRLYELVQSDTDPALLMGKGKQSEDKAIRRESWGAYTLYSGFPQKDAISGVEYIDMVRTYIDPPVMA